MLTEQPCRTWEGPAVLPDGRDGAALIVETSNFNG
jgi:hypothetical protein